MELTKVCAYCRVSTGSEEQETSFKNQKVYFERELNKEKGFDLIGIYADEGLTGTEFKNRNQFNEMLYDAGLDMRNIKLKQNSIEKRNTKTVYIANHNRKSKFKYIYVKNSSRFARNIAVMDILRELKSKGVYVYFLDVNKSTENESDEMLLQMLFMLDENDSKDKSRKIKFGARETAKQGKVRIGYELYGYTYNKVENTLRMIEEEADIVRLIYNLAEEGKGSRQISNILRDSGIKTRRGKEFRHNVILRMLQNPIYCGNVVRNKWDNGELFVDHSKKMNDKTEWIIQKSKKVDIIISNEQFENVQTLIRKRTNSVSAKGVYKGRSEFAGKIRCGICGSYYNKNSEVYKGNKRIFYNCSLKKQKGVHNCNSRNVNQDEIEKLITMWTQKGYLKNWYDAHINKIFSIYNDTKKSYVESYNNRKEFLKQDELNKLELDLTDLLEKYLNASDIMKKVLDNKIKEIEIKIKELEEEKKLAITKEKDIEHRLFLIDTAMNKILEGCKKVSNIISREEFLEGYLTEFVVLEDRILVMLIQHLDLFSLKCMALNQKDFEDFKDKKKYNALDLYNFVES